MDDTITETDEFFFLNISSLLNATITDGQGVCTIRDNESPTGPPTVQVNARELVVSEGTSSLQVTVTRSGNPSGALSVNYRTVDTDTFRFGCAETLNREALGRCDFATVVGVLNFGPGEVSKVVSVPIIDDAYVESNERFQIQLSNPIGGTLGIPAATSVIIQDNDQAGEPNPIFMTPFFVRQHYLDFLSREPEPVGFDAWINLLNSCSDVNNNPTCDRLTVSGAFFGSQEFQLKGFYVFRFYKLAFDRLPQYVEIISDMSFVSGTTPEEVFARKGQLATNFTQRQEFLTNFGALSNQDYVLQLLNRYQLSQVTTPDPAAPDGTNKVTLTTADLTNQLTGGVLTRAQVLRAIADSDELLSLEFNRAFVAMQYYGYLRRTPETAGYNSWLAYLTAHPTDSRTMVNGFMNSVEYRLRFGP